MANQKSIKESDIKQILNRKISKNITKKDLEDLNAWNEVKEWFEIINDIIKKYQTSRQ